MSDGSGPKRFYETVSLEPDENGVALTLDGRGARTPGRAKLVLPTRPLGEAVAAEWRDQGERIDPRSMPLTRLANSAIDGVAATLEPVRDEIARYASSDLVLYRAGDPERLVEDQAAAWDPVLAFARETLGARFILGEGVMHVEQPRVALDRVAAALADEGSPFRLAALHVVTTLTGSALLALMLAADRVSPADAWRAAHVDELFQESRWGTDAEALARRAAREAEFSAAAAMLRLARIES